MAAASTPLRVAPVLAGAVLAGACAAAEGSRAGGSARPEAGATEEPVESQQAANTLSEEERRMGFELLFDGESPEAWRGFRREDIPAGWSARDGALAFTPGAEGGDLITRETFADFDLRLEWKVSPGGNSGIMFGVVEDADRTYESGPEMQVLDDAGHPDGRNPLTSAGSNYGLHARSADVVHPAGEWNEARIVRRGARVEHWLNGEKIIEYELGSDDWKSRVAGSKFARWPDYGAHHEGHIALQDHGDPVWFRNLRILRLDP